MTMSVMFLTMRCQLDKKRTYLHCASHSSLSVSGYLLLLLFLLQLPPSLLLLFGVAFMRLFAQRFVCRSTFARCVTDVNMDGPAQPVSVSRVAAAAAAVTAAPRLPLLLLLLLYACRSDYCCCYDKCPSSRGSDSGSAATDQSTHVAGGAIYSSSSSNVIYYACVCVGVEASVECVCVSVRECVAYAALLIFIFARFTRALLHLFALSLTAVATHIFFTVHFFGRCPLHLIGIHAFSRVNAVQQCARVCMCVYSLKLLPTHTSSPGTLRLPYAHTATLYAVVHLKNATVNAFSFAALALPTPLTTTHL